MFFHLSFGDITEPLARRTWKREQILHRAAQRRAYFAHRGMNQNDRVFVHYGNRIEFFIDLVSVWSLGACLVPVDPRLTAFEIETLARAANPRFSIWHDLPEDSLAAALASKGTQVLTTEEPRESLGLRTGSEELRRSLLLDQEALILFTSGTTGSPKGVVHTHRSLRARWITLQQTLGIDVFKRTLCLLPTHFGHGLICNCLFPWLSGQDLFILPPFKNDVILQLGELLDAHEITFMSSVPPVWRLALKVASPPRAGKLKRVFCGSAPLSGHLWKGIKEWTGAPEVLNAYGITETASWLAGTTVSEVSAEDGLIGVAWGGIIKILDCSEGGSVSMFSDEKKANESGYVWVNTPALMKGYLDNDELTRKVVSQGWFFTGDIGLKDDRGWLYLRGREREEINKGGMKVYPGDVDALVERFEEVLDVCTFAYEDPLLGENVGIAMVLKCRDDLTLKRLFDWTKLHLAQHQLPSRWYLLDEIPRTSRGKINREGIAATCKGVRPLDLRSLSGIVENNQGVQVNDH